MTREGKLEDEGLSKRKIRSGNFGAEQTVSLVSQVLRDR